MARESQIYTILKFSNPSVRAHMGKCNISTRLREGLHCRPAILLTHRSVHLARKYDGPQLYALKKMTKRSISRKNMVDQGVWCEWGCGRLGLLNSVCSAVIAERDALALINTPFVVKIFYSFQTRDDIYLVCDQNVVNGARIARLPTAVPCAGNGVLNWWRPRLASLSIRIV